MNPHTSPQETNERDFIVRYKDGTAEIIRAYDFYQNTQTHLINFRTYAIDGKHLLCCAAVQSSAIVSINRLAVTNNL